MEWITINSSRCDAARYNNGIIEVRFTDGAIYQYNVGNKSVFDDFINSSSQGKFINDVLNAYPYNRA